MTSAACTESDLLPSTAGALITGVRDALWLSPGGEVETLSSKEAAGRASGAVPPLVCHAAAAAARLGCKPFRAFDLLELFAFVRPAWFCLPTPRGLAEVLGLPLPGSREKEAETLFAAARVLLSELGSAGEEASPVALAMARGGWPWGEAALAALKAETASPSGNPVSALKVWNWLPEWEDRTPEPPSGEHSVDAGEAVARLKELLGDQAEERPQQADYASRVVAAFRPRDHDGLPRTVLAEAGTGVGKTLGYIAPASLWAQKNKGTVWISTFTRNLQHQLDGELDRLYPDPAEKAAKVVIRKGRENYFCLLNFEEALARPTASGEDAVALGLMARWVLGSRDGDMLGGDFPAWLAVLLGRALTTALTDTRGECIYSACPHYNKCFIEATIRRARRAEIVVANHALVMIQAAFGGDEAYLPSRYVFDEGHHLFGTADSVFSAHLSGMETADLRRWLVGAEKGSRTRSPGLKKRIEDQLAGDAQAALHEVLQAALALPAAGWRQRLAEDGPRGPAEIFLARVRQQVYARKQGGESSYSLETSPRPAVPGLLAAAAALAAALIRMDKPLAALIKALDGLLDDKADELDSATRSRIEATSRGLGRRGLQQLRAWCAMLEALEGPTPDEFIDWFGVERVDGRDIDVGFYRHWIDPTRPFAEIVAQPAHGLLMTSATLCDNSGDKDSDWGVALMRTGARHLASSPVKALVPSPFDYAGLTRIMVVTDVKRDDIHQVAAAYRELFLAAGGGALGLFTAIARLRRVNGSIAGPLEAAGLSLLVQHVDGLDTGTLIDIFRAEEDACLLGTDAVRDGIDMPGRSLRLIVFDRVPWPRPDIVHRSRRQAFGGREYDDMLTRLRLKQAYGRLVRRADDRGVFILLDRGLPSRLAGAFPEDVPVRRLGLAEAVVETKGFLAAGA